MPTNKPIALGDLLSDPASPLSRVSGAVERMNDLARSIRDALPDDLKPHLVSANVRDDRLILVADSAVWAARLRFYATDALQYSASIHTSPLAGVDVRVRPDWPTADSSGKQSDSG